MIPKFFAWSSAAREEGSLPVSPGWGPERKGGGTDPAAYGSVGGFLAYF